MPDNLPCARVIGEGVAGLEQRGAFDQASFDTYHVLRMSEVPAVEIYIVESTAPPTGIAEPGVTVVAPALANAILAATSARVRRAPFLPAHVLEAIGAKA